MLGCAVLCCEAVLLCGCGELRVVVCSCARQRAAVCDPCVCVVGVWCEFRRVDRWDLAVLASLGGAKDLAESDILSL